MYKHFYHKDWGKTTKQRVRQIITIGLPEEIKPEDVAEFGFTPFINTPQPEITNLQKIVDDGLEVTATEASQKWKVVNKFETLAQETEYLTAVFISTKESWQSKNKDACKSHILSKYPLEIQASMNAGVYSALAFEAYQTFLAACINEENRVFDLLEAALTIEELTLVPEPTWPEV